MDEGFPHSLARPISPPPMNARQRMVARQKSSESLQTPRPSLPASIEAGKTAITDHIDYFGNHLSQVTRSESRLSIQNYVSLYQSNCCTGGHHFVIHQHNHPVAGCHYDLRLQFSETSTMSFAIPYGVPGNPNSRRQGRMAIETRIHNLWNNLIESASSATGSLLIWDTGTYEVLPRRLVRKGKMTDDESDSDVGMSTPKNHFENEKLIDAFQSRYMRLRLHGHRLPKGYTVTLRLPSKNDINKQLENRPPKKLKRRIPPTLATDLAGSSSDPEIEDATVSNEQVGLASDDEDESSTIRKNNAYIGATNSIGSIHQRHWYMTLDKVNSGFRKVESKWVPAEPGRGFEPFFVMGAEVEKSIVTGRTSAEVFADEGVEGFRARKMWRPILE